MTDFLQFLVAHGYLVIFAWVALDQAGLPLPALPLLLAAGALAGTGELSILAILVVCALAAVPIDLFWFWLGRLRGVRVLHLLCILSLEPDYCVRDTEALFKKLGPLSVVLAKFVPGLQTLAPPMSGLTGMNMLVFFILDLIGTLVWSASFVLVGFYFHTELELMAQKAADAGLIAGLFLAGIVAAYFTYKIVTQQRFLRSLRMRRLTPEDVQQRISKGDDFHILDLRHDYDFDAYPHLLPGALRVPMESIDRHNGRIPKDSDIVLYCS
ncbi:MAG: sulfurtransferase [Gammaproteobacteria bacterium]|jgi:membrane protein DedA with SNARE-associated domain|nr:sulfurtransferase [Gammaproteobacteria bacterium]MBT5152597.1 sulfurtransferase [Gammaproteobacteria bacterium]MBT5685373.1 sulfurtransferase [Gammaproteobacteria bacterium]MBT5724013.1 sulfurtransferase [Gammaproteobacteria bacterium]MBT6584780.1 sulfurtransferase [Gammaproteobacteria bacterium]